jgi:hypothetical protein
MIAIGLLGIQYFWVVRKAMFLVCRRPSAGSPVFVTREGNMGIIETTDRVTRTADLTETIGGAPSGVGFHLGVRFNLRTVVP